MFSLKNSTRYRIIEVLHLFADSILPIIFWVSLIFGFDAPYIAVLTLVSAVVHELGHFLAIYCRGKNSAILRGHSSGFRIRMYGTLSYRDEIIVLLAGPLANICVFLLTLPFQGALYGYFGTIGILNLITGLSNLIPIEGHDGYGVICEILRLFGHAELIKPLGMLSFVASIGITFVSLYLIERFGEGYWLFGLFFVTVLSKIAFLGKYDIFEE